MRLFVAVELGDQMVRVATETAARLRREIAPQIRAAWVPPANMHLTVRFIGHVDDSRAPAILEALTPALDIDPFDVDLGGCGCFPPSGPPRVIWVGLARGLPSLAAMHHAFDRRLLPFGFEPETRPFGAHLTLARIKDAEKRASAAVREAIRTHRPASAQSHVTRATIFQSHLSSKGPRYEALAHVPLAGATNGHR
jgi:RNA 2',3'-cyclic 3'-phosphodiesterase